MTELSAPLPAFLVERYHKWKSSDYADNQDMHRTLVSDGQHPPAMVISCCDSRVHATDMSGVQQGEFFMHRNIASLVPPVDADGEQTGTAAAVEYAVKVLKVAHLVIIGHSHCGGVQGCLDMCTGKAPELADTFIGRWVKTLSRKVDLVTDLDDPVQQARALERHAVRMSLENLMTYPFVADAVAAGQLSLHGLWTDIGEGDLEQLDPASGDFVAI